MVCCWKVKEKRSHGENILKEASKTNGLTTEYLHKTLFSLVNVGTIRASKTLQSNGSYYISNIDDFEALVGT